MNTAVWGGIFNPIIPVPDEGDAPWVDQLIRRFLVDVLVATADTPAIKQAIERHDHLRWPHLLRENDPLIRQGDGGKRYFSVVDMRLPLSHYWWREFRHAGGQTGLIPGWSANNESRWQLSVWFGGFPSDDSIPNLKEDFQNATGATSVDVDEGITAAEFLDRDYPILFTSLGLGLQGRFLDWQAGVVVGQRENADHLALFWNLRASGADVTFWPEDPEGYIDVTRDHITNIVASQRGPLGPHGRRGIEIWECLDFGTDISQVQRPHELDERLRALIPDGVIPFHGDLCDWSWDQPTLSHLPPSTDKRTILASTDERYGGAILAAEIGTHPFTEARETPDSSRQLWVWTLRPYGSEGLPTNTTLRLPFIRDLNEWYSRQMLTVDPWSLRVQPEGFDLIKEVWNTRLGLTLIPEERIIGRLFERAHITMSASEPGRMAQRVMEMMGGLRGVSLFKIPGVRRLLKKAPGREALAFDHAAELIRDRSPAHPDGSFARFAERWRFGREPLDARDAFRSLLGRGVFRAALKIRCPNCRMLAVIDADDVRNEVACTLCGKPFLLGSYLRGDDWVYRLSGVFAQVSGDKGAIAPLLSMLAIGENIRIEELFLLHAQDLSISSTRCESDIVALEISREGTPSLCVAECKQRGSVSEDDVRRLAEVRRAVRESGVECFVMFACLRPEFTEDELTLFRETSNSWAKEKHLGVPRHHYSPAPSPILLTERELEYDWMLDADQMEGLPHQHPFSFQDFAENSQARYLGERTIPNPFS